MRREMVEQAALNSEAHLMRQRQFERGLVNADEVYCLLDHEIQYSIAISLKRIADALEGK